MCPMVYPMSMLLKLKNVLAESRSDRRTLLVTYTTY